MAVDVRIPTVLRQYTGSVAVVHAEGKTVGEVLEDIDRRYPGFLAQLLEDGQVRKFVNIYVNDEDIRYLGSLQAPVRQGDEVSILPAVAGGSCPCPPLGPLPCGCPCS